MSLRENWEGFGWWNPVAEWMNAVSRFINRAGGVKIVDDAIFRPFVGAIWYGYPPGDNLTEQKANIGSGWHFANGATVTLANATSFVLPNLRGQYFVGLDDSGTDADYNVLGETLGYETHGLNENNHPNHIHEFTDTDPANTGCLDATTGKRYSINDHIHNGGYGDPEDTDNRPPSTVLFALIWVGVPTENGVVPT